METDKQFSQEDLDNIVASRIERLKQDHLAELENFKAQARLHMAANNHQPGDVKDFLSLSAAKAAAEDMERSELLKIHGKGRSVEAQRLYRENKLMFDATKRRAQELGILPKPSVVKQSTGNAFRRNDT